MIKSKSLRHRLKLIVIATVALLLSACSIRDNAINPGNWGYDCVVIYDALGGVINTREVRETYYMKNSYLFKPSGTANMMVEPVKDGYILAGWYTAKEDILDSSGNVVGYSFKAEDRWDFDEDRVQGDMTLYARWIPQGKVEYIDADTGDIMFSKNITESSPVQELSGAALTLISKAGHTFLGYFADSACTIPYEFAQYKHRSLIPSNEEVYAQLYEEFPQFFRKIEYVEPEGGEEEPEFSNPDLFINKLGYEITTDREEDRAKIRARKDQIYEEAINEYIKNTENTHVYLKYIKGNYARIASAEDLKNNGKYGFLGTDRYGNPVDGYILTRDIDFKGITLEMTENFKGKIYGNGYSLKNITINVSSRKIDTDSRKSAGLFLSMDGAYIENLTLENMSINVNTNPGISVTIGALAVEANRTQLKDIRFVDLTINTGRGDDGSASYIVSDLIARGRNNTVTNVTGENVEINASEFAQINEMLTREP
ncbi:MAG TPA: InlB B-repeat-containing protein [Clostridiaceae bacterium]|nr:InlB B-repeat-containing protein [Clostridiaceae bacterium]